MNQYLIGEELFKELLQATKNSTLTCATTEWINKAQAILDDGPMQEPQTPVNSQFTDEEWSAKIYNSYEEGRRDAGPITDDSSVDMSDEEMQSAYLNAARKAYFEKAAYQGWQACWNYLRDQKDKR